MITLQLSRSAEETLAQLQAFPAEMRKAIARGMDKGAALVTGEIVRSRYTGKGPFPVDEHRLGVRTNRLRSSLRWSKAVVSGDVIAGSIGSNVEYADVHEYGYQGTVTVKPFERKVSPTQFAKAGTGLTAKQRKTKKSRTALLGTERVRAHQKIMNIPARGPLTAGLVEHQETFLEQIGAALEAAWAKKGGGKS